MTSRTCPALPAHSVLVLATHRPDEQLAAAYGRHGLSYTGLTISDHLSLLGPRWKPLDIRDWAAAWCVPTVVPPNGSPRGRSLAQQVLCEQITVAELAPAGDR